MLTPLKHQIPYLLYSGVRIYPTVNFVFLIGERLITHCSWSSPFHGIQPCRHPGGPTEDISADKRPCISLYHTLEQQCTSPPSSPMSSGYGKLPRGGSVHRPKARAALGPSCQSPHNRLHTVVLTFHLFNKPVHGRSLLKWFALNQRMKWRWM